MFFGIQQPLVIRGEPPRRSLSALLEEMTKRCDQKSEAVIGRRFPPTGGFHHGGVSLWPCSSRRQVARHGRQPGGANASVGGS